MLRSAPPRPTLQATPLQSNLALAYQKSPKRPVISQVETLRIDVGTFVTDDSLVIDSVSEEQLHELPAAIIVFLRRASRRGYCPPIPALRRLGFRTKREVDAQRLARCWRW